MKISNNFNIIINGEIVNIFPLRSGRRQGDTLSPLLFTITLEELTLIEKNKRHKIWKGISKTILICR